jgi:hypothetical protein
MLPGRPAAADAPAVESGDRGDWYDTDVRDRDSRDVIVVTRPARSKAEAAAINPHAVDGGQTARNSRPPGRPEVHTEIVAGRRQKVALC